MKNMPGDDWKNLSAQFKTFLGVVDEDEQDAWCKKEGKKLLGLPRKERALDLVDLGYFYEKRRREEENDLSGADEPLPETDIMKDKLVDVNPSHKWALRGQKMNLDRFPCTAGELDIYVYSADRALVAEDKRIFPRFLSFY